MNSDGFGQAGSVVWMVGHWGCKRGHSTARFLGLFPLALFVPLPAGKATPTVIAVGRQIDDPTTIVGTTPAPFWQVPWRLTTAALCLGPDLVRTVEFTVSSSLELVVGIHKKPSSSSPASKLLFRYKGNGLPSLQLPFLVSILYVKSTDSLSNFVSNRRS
ncbi:hypothetical protein B0H66DRAFT_226114 [Apodospora peruviana]|uniref:Uncharacterized protein n=1 Tax=Apodospora peruviana TaxID=516989 RepID=A0AAE0M3W9_9PEZI|nr:hypothetical protein B0H66DRAFT_226114 [Apodospora peruviana]